MLNDIIVIIIATIVLPLVVYLCMKFGTVAYYRAKENMEKSNKES